MTWLDGAALAFFLAGWWFLGWLIDASPWHRHTLSAAMKTQRREWMRQMAAASGFASSTPTSSPVCSRRHRSLHRLRYLLSARAAFYVKTAVLMALYAYAFFKFGWAYRIFNYSAVMLAATPEAEQEGAEEAAAEAEVAEMNISAASQFTHGLRAFFLESPCSPGSSIPGRSQRQRWSSSSLSPIDSSTRRRGSWRCVPQAACKAKPDTASFAGVDASRGTE